MHIDFVEGNIVFDSNKLSSSEHKRKSDELKAQLRFCRGCKHLGQVYDHKVTRIAGNCYCPNFEKKEF